MRENSKKLEYVRRNLETGETSDSEIFTPQEAERENNTLRVKTAPYRWVRKHPALNAAWFPNPKMQEMYTAALASADSKKPEWEREGMAECNIEGFRFCCIVRYVYKERRSLRMIRRVEWRINANIRDAAFVFLALEGFPGVGPEVKIVY